MKLLFHYPFFKVGGAEMSSLRLMTALADRGHDITLVVTTGGGELEEALDGRIRLVRLRPSMYGAKFLGARGLLARSAALPDFLAYLTARAIGGIRMLPFFLRRYDASATLLHGTSTWFCRRVVRAPSRMHFIRNDLKHVDPSGRVAKAIRHAEPEIDYYVCVSQTAHQSLIAAVPETAPKATVVYNILNPDEMRQRMTKGGDPFPPRRGDELRILTVCRLSEMAKGLTRMVRVCQRLADAGLAFRWFVVGDGNDRALLENAIRKAGLENRIILMGRFSNPFPAYVHADVVAMVSYYEGLCGMVNEAKIAGRAVVATKVSGIDEQLVDGETGLIVDNNEDAIVEGMQRVLTDTKLRSKISNDYLPPALLDDEAKLDKLEQMMQG